MATCRLFPSVNHFNMYLFNICILASYRHICDIIIPYYYFVNHLPVVGQLRPKHVEGALYLYKTAVFTFFRKETNYITKLKKKPTCVLLTKPIIQSNTTSVPVASIRFREKIHVRQVEVSKNK